MGVFGSEGNSLQDVILIILALVIIVIFIGCLYAFIVAIFKFLFSKGDEGKIKEARDSIRFMIVGIILTIVLLFVFPLVFKLFKVEGYEMYTAKNIFNKAGRIISKITTLTTQIKTGYEQSDFYDGRRDALQGSSSSSSSSSSTPATTSSDLEL